MTDPENLMTPETEAAVAASPAADVFDAKIVPASAFDPVQRTMQTMLELATKGDPQSLAGLERLEGVLVRAQERQASQEFSTALAAFQKDCPPVPKTRNVSSSGGIDYDYASLDDIIRVIRPVATKHGLSWSFDSVHGDGGITETCTVRHVGGHSVTSQSPVVTTESRAGMSPQQKCGSAQTYARRYALTGALGITTGDVDDDAQPRPSATPPQKITEEQAVALEIEVDQVQGDLGVLLDFCQQKFGRPIGDVRDFTTDEYPKVLRAVRAKAKS